MITANVRAQRARMQLSQYDIAKRMQAFGYRWYQQTAGLVERGERKMTPDEMVALAICLETTPAVLLQPVTAAVTMPGGQKIRAQRLAAIDGSVTFDGNAPQVSDEPGRMPAPEQRIADLEERMEHLSEYARYLRREAREPNDQQRHGTYEPGKDAVDIQPRRGRSRPRRGEDQR